MAGEYEARMSRVQTYIHDHPAGDLSLDHLADIAALSRFHFQRTYRLLTGETAAQAVRRIRMHRASVALIHSNAPLHEIARAVGYPNLASFSRVFSETFGTPPSAFRNSGTQPAPSVVKPNLTSKGTAMFPISIRIEPARHLAAIPHKGDYQLISRNFEKLFTTLAIRGQMQQTGAMIGVYFDDPESIATKDLRSLAAVEFPADADLAPPIERATLPAGRHAVLRFKGPYTGLPAGYSQLFREWLPQSNEEPGDSPAFEIYLNNPRETPPEDLLTEICLPLK